MKALMATAAALALLAGMTAANAQNAPARTDKSMQQSTMGAGAASGEQKVMKRTHKRVAHLKKKRHGARFGGETMGSGNRTGTIGGPRNDPSIHQSIGRDSRGTPKDQKAY